MPNTGPNLLDAADGIETGAAPIRFERWLAANAVVLRATGALALARQGADHRVIASWPGQTEVNSALRDAATAALEGGFHLSRGHSRDPSVAIVGVRVRLGGRPGALGFELPVLADEAESALVERVRSTVLRRVEDIDATTQSAPVLAVHAPVARVEPVASRTAHLEELITRQGVALDVMAAMLDHPTIEQASRAYVDALATRFSCKRVALGSRRLRRVVLDAVSGTADFDRRSAVMAALARALKETVDSATVFTLPPAPFAKPLPGEHRVFATSAKAQALVSVPLVEAGKVVGALMLERDRPFDDQEIELLKQLVVLSAPVFSLKKRDASGPLKRSWYATQRQLGRLVGFDNLLLKTVVAGVLALALWSSHYTRTFSVDAEAAIEASATRGVVAGSSSYISEVGKRAGDVVYQGDVLARLDVEDLQLERLKWESEREKLTKEQRATLAQRDRTRIRVLSVKRAQAQTQIDFLDAQIARAVLRAPIDGVVISGDLSEALGSPVERGQLLFEVASLTDYKLVLTVDESDIGEIAEGYQGRLRLRSMPHQTYEFVVTRITPVSQPEDGKNRFRLEASLQETPAMLRPGMGGIAKIDAGERPIGWIWTRSFTRWARLQLWKFGLL